MIINHLLHSHNLCIRRLDRTTCGLNRWSRNSSVLFRDRWCWLTFFCMLMDCLMDVCFPNNPNRPMWARKHPDWKNWWGHCGPCIETASQIEPKTFLVYVSQNGFHRYMMGFQLWWLSCGVHCTPGDASYCPRVHELKQMLLPSPSSEVLCISIK